MLQRSNTESVFTRAEPDNAEPGGLRELVDLAFGVLRRHYVCILFCTVFGIGAGAVYLHLAPPTYTATSQIIIGTQSAPFIQQQSLFTDRAVDSPHVDSQLQIIKSRAIASAVVDELNLPDDPAFGTPTLGLIHRALEDLSNSTAPLSQLTKRETSDKREAAIDAVTDGLKVNRVGISYVIEISFSSPSAGKAAQIANAVANAYIGDHVAYKYQANRSANTWLRERMQELGEQSEKAESDVVAFKKEHDIVSADGKLIAEQRVMDLNGRLVAARAQTTDLLARLNRIETILRTGNPNAAFDSGISDGLTNPILTNLRQQYLELTRRESEYSARYGRNHLAVVNLRNRLQGLSSSTFEEFRRIAEAYKSDYEIAKQRQEEIEKQLANAVAESQTTNQSQVILRELESRAKSLRSLYESFVQRQMASVQQESFPITEARLLSVATTPTTKSKPKTMLVLALAVVGGIGLGAAGALLKDLLDRSFRTGAQLQAALQIPCLALVPLLKSKERGPLPRRRDKPRSEQPVGERTIARCPGVFWSVVDSPSSPFAESIRSIKLAINLSMTASPTKVVGFTSSLPNEGKSTIAAAFALLTRQLGGRVIIVDCDLRNPSLSRRLAPEATSGLADVISGARPWEEAVWRDSTNNLVLLPALKQRTVFQDNELLAAASGKQLFDKLRANFDYVVVDLPPLAPVHDVRATIQLVDCAILVVEWGQTKIGAVQHALNTAPNVQEALIGAILNKADMDRIKRYDAEYGALYHSKYYARYG